MLESADLAEHSQYDVGSIFNGPLAFCAASDRLGIVCAAGAGPCQIQIIDLARKKVLRVIPNVGEHIDGLRFSADGAKIVANDFEKIGMWDVASGKSESFRLIPYGTLTFAPDGSRVAAFGFFCALAIWDYASFGPRLAMEKGLIHWSDVGVIDTDVAAFSPDGHTLAGNGGKTAAPLLGPQNETRPAGDA